MHIFLASCLWLMKVTLLQTPFTCLWANLWAHKQEIFLWVQLLIKVMCYFIFLKMFWNSRQYTFPPEHMWALARWVTMPDITGVTGVTGTRALYLFRSYRWEVILIAIIFHLFIEWNWVSSLKIVFLFSPMPACVLSPGLLCTVHLSFVDF